MIAFSSALDLVSPILTNHHQRVAYIALRFADEIGLPEVEKTNVFIGALIHDSGALSLRERLDALEFELKNPHEHTEMGYRYLKDFSYLADSALLIRYHHTDWQEGSHLPLGSHIINLADRIAVLIKGDQEILGQVEGIHEQIKYHRASRFQPDLVDIFSTFVYRPAFWLDALHPRFNRNLLDSLEFPNLEINSTLLKELSHLFSRIIAACASQLAEFMGFSPRECRMMEIAGYLHDLGKLAIPTELLEKPGKLSRGEYGQIKSHSFYTYRVLELIPGLELISRWASFHHERIDGQGYPFGIQGDELNLGCRIMAIADVFTALSEDRPYRQGLDQVKVFELMNEMVKDGALDAKVMSILHDNYDQIAIKRIKAQKEAQWAYQSLQSSEK